MSPLAALLALSSAAPFAVLRAQSASARLSAATDSVPDSFTARVAAAVAHDWGVDPGRLVLSWGRGPLSRISATSSFKLLGLGDGGWLAVVLDPDGERPAALRLRVGFTEDQLVAARPIRAGTILVDADFRREPHVHWGPPDTAQHTAPVAGWVAKRGMAEGTVLAAGRVTPPPVIRAGSPVRVTYRNSNVSIATDGVALNDGATGEIVRIRTPRKTGVISATVTAPGEAVVN
jgi:flagella basal body P-ring formation protein FlgA